MSRYTKPGLTLSPTEGGTGISLDTADDGTLLIGDGAGGFTPNLLTAGSGVTITNGSGTISISATGLSGTVTSVGLTAPGEFSISGSPVTVSGNLGLSWANQSGNVILASPSGGGSGAPGFRALVAADIPNLDTAKITTGTLNLARLSGITTSQLSSTAGIVAGQIASVNPSVLTGSGTVPLAGLTGITTSQLSATAGITSGQIASIPNQNASIITTGTLVTARGGTGLDASGATNGQLLIGTGSGLALSTLTAGSNVTITNASGAITIASTGGGGGSSTLAGDTDVDISSPTDAQWLQYNTSLGKWQNQTPSGLNPNTKVQLDYNEITDLANNLNLSLNTWTDILSNQTFTVDDPNSVIEIDVGGFMIVGNLASANIGTRLVIDSAGTPINKRIGGARSEASVYENVLAGSGPVTLTGLSAGSHTVKFQVYSDTANIKVFCLCSTAPNTYALTLRVLERKQSSSPPSSTPAPAVRASNSGTTTVHTATYTALTFDTTVFDQGTSTEQHSTGSNTGRLTCQQAGVYQITGEAEPNLAVNTADVFEIFIRLNGTTQISDSQTIYNGDGCTAFTTTLYKLSVGDYVELVLWQNHGSDATIYATSYSPLFMMARVDTGSVGILLTTTQTANYSIPSVNTLTVVGAASKTMTLPTAAGVAGQSCVVKNNASGTSTTVATTSSQTIDGASTYSLASAWASAKVVSDGSNWVVV